MTTCAACGLSIYRRAEIRSSGHFLLHASCVNAPRETWAALAGERETARLRRDLLDLQEQLGQVRRDRTRLESTERHLLRQVEEMTQTALIRQESAARREERLHDEIANLSADIRRMNEAASRPSISSAAAPSSGSASTARPEISEVRDTEEPVEQDDSTTRYSLLELDT